MRTALALTLALLVVAAAAAPHVHVGVTGTERCVVCLVHQADAARTEAPDVEPAEALEGEPARAPGLPPVAGAPLGAVPGQSPPALA